MTVENLRRAALAETVTWLALLAAMVVKYGMGNEIGVTVMGPVHGIIVLVYGWIVLGMREELAMRTPTFVAALLATVVPFGASYVIDRRVLPLAPRGA